MTPGGLVSEEGQPIYAAAEITSWGLVNETENVMGWLIFMYLKGASLFNPRAIFH